MTATESDSDADASPATLAGGHSRRGKKRTDAAELMIAAAFELFATRGYDDVSVEEIAEHAGVSARTFYRRFGSREAMVVREFEKAGELFFSAIDAQPETATPSELVVGAMQSFGKTRRSTDFPGLSVLHIPALRSLFEAYLIGIEADISARLATRCHREPTDPIVRACSAWFSTTFRLAVNEAVDIKDPELVIERVAPAFLLLADTLELAFTKH